MRYARGRCWETLMLTYAGRCIGTSGVGLLALMSKHHWTCPHFVESRLGASADAEAPPRFPAPLIKPDVPISSIRLSERLHLRLTTAAMNGCYAIAAPQTTRTPLRPDTARRRATAPYVAESGIIGRAYRRDDRRPGTP